MVTMTSAIHSNHRPAFSHQQHAAKQNQPLTIVRAGYLKDEVPGYTEIPNRSGLTLLVNGPVLKIWQTLQQHLDEAVILKDQQIGSRLGAPPKLIEAVKSLQNKQNRFIGRIIRHHRTMGTITNGTNITDTQRQQWITRHERRRWRKAPGGLKAQRQHQQQNWLAERLFPGTMRSMGSAPTRR